MHWLLCIVGVALLLLGTYVGTCGKDAIRVGKSYFDREDLCMGMKTSGIGLMMASLLVCYLNQVA